MFVIDRKNCCDIITMIQKNSNKSVDEDSILFYGVSEKKRMNKGSGCERFYSGIKEDHLGAAPIRPVDYVIIIN